MNTLALILTLLIGVAVGFRPRQPFYVFSWISAYVGLSVRDPETAQSAGFIWVFPLVFASSAFVPSASMPGVAHTFADINPVTQTANAARALTIGHQSALGPTLATLAWLAGLLLVFVPWPPAPSGEPDRPSPRARRILDRPGGFAGGPGLRPAMLRRDDHPPARKPPDTTAQRLTTTNCFQNAAGGAGSKPRSTVSPSASSDRGRR